MLIASEISTAPERETKYLTKYRSGKCLFKAAGVAAPPSRWSGRSSGAVVLWEERKIARNSPGSLFEMDGETRAN